MTACCLGLMRYAPSLPQPEQIARPMWRRFPTEVREIFANRSFRLLFISAVITYVAQGLNATLNSHAFVFVWLLKSENIQFISYAFVVGSSSASSRRRDPAPAGEEVGGRDRPLPSHRQLAGDAGHVAARPLQPDRRRGAGAHAVQLVRRGDRAGLRERRLPSMMADAADEHEHLFGRRREGSTSPA
jgi:GPH family glycoside/pentoside/hexuronide:cation symporter